MLSEFVSDIVREKSGTLLDVPENELQFSPYMVQRFLSMFSGAMCHILNETTNKVLSSMEKKEIYRLMLCVVPPQKKTFARYLKKGDELFVLTDQQKQAVDLLAQKHKLSKKDIEKYMKELGLNIDKYTKGLE